MNLSLRRFTGAALLGLPAALTAHALVFGGEHAAGGAFHNAALALAALAALLVLAMQTRAMAQGTVFAARLREHVPGFAGLVLAGSGWFAGLELCERPHGVPIVLTAAALAVAAFAVRLCMHAVAHSLCACIIALAAGRFIHAHRVRLDAWYSPVPVTSSRAREHRLFSRPPPLLS